MRSAVIADAWAAGLQRLMLPDGWQAEAIQALLAGEDVVVDAPTGAGKTYVFERWAEQSNFSQRAVFTVPTRALANDKYAEWRERGWRVGIVTGDVTIDPAAPVVVATLEAVQRDLTDGVGDTARLLVVDEYQWISDPLRGNHYEGVLLALPPSVQLLLLSGSVGNPGDVADWLRALGRRVRLVRTRERPVPLEECDVDDLVRGLPREIEGFWARRLAGALREGMGPVLAFAPHRRDAERMARQFAREVPLAEPLTLTPAQEQAAGPQLAKLLRQRVAYHHSGLSYVQRAGGGRTAGQGRAVAGRGGDARAECRDQFFAALGDGYGRTLPRGTGGATDRAPRPVADDRTRGPPWAGRGRLHVGERAHTAPEPCGAATLETRGAHALDLFAARSAGGR